MSYKTAACLGQIDAGHDITNASTAYPFREAILFDHALSDTGGMTHVIRGAGGDVVLAEYHLLGDPAPHQCVHIMQHLLLRVLKRTLLFMDKLRLKINTQHFQMKRKTLPPAMLVQS